MSSKNKIKISWHPGRAGEEAVEKGKFPNKHIRASLWWHFVDPSPLDVACVPRVLLTQPPENVNVDSSFLICLLFFYHYRRPFPLVFYLYCFVCFVQSGKSNLEMTPFADYLRKIYYARAYHLCCNIFLVMIRMWEIIETFLYVCLYYNNSWRKCFSKSIIYLKAIGYMYISLASNIWIAICFNIWYY